MACPAIHGWVFTSNHVHLLAKPAYASSLPWLMQYLGRLQVRCFSCAHMRSGAVSEGRFKTCVVQEDHYLLNCLRYIEHNPVRGGMVGEP